MQNAMQFFYIIEVIILNAYARYLYEYREKNPKMRHSKTVEQLIEKTVKLNLPKQNYCHLLQNIPAYLIVC